MIMGIEMVDTIEIDSYVCRIYRTKEKQIQNIIFWFESAERMDITEHMFESLKKEKGLSGFALVVIMIKDWNKELSPWKAPAVFGSEKFFGEGEQLKNWLLKVGVTKLLKALSVYERKTKCYIGGYSLAGLFALWVACESDFFDGIACCSGSLWYPGWMEYAKVHRLKESAKIYLSLGKKEEKTRNAIMRTIGDCTRNLATFYKESGQDVVLEWNNGNHFSDVAERCAKGCVWLLTEDDKLKL